MENQKIIKETFVELNNNKIKVTICVNDKTDLLKNLYELYKEKSKDGTNDET